MSKIARLQRGKDVFSQMQDDFNRFLAPLEGYYNEFSQATVQDWMPKLDVSEDNNHYMVHVDLPGLTADNVDISVENNVLTIRGKRDFEHQSEKRNRLRVERVSGNFLRRIAMPENLDPSAVEARFKNGVLEIKIPKLTQSGEQKIKIIED